MTREEMTEMVSETICVSGEEARAALEACDWNVLDAGQALLQRRRRKEKADRVNLGNSHSLHRFFTRLAAAVR